MVDNAPAHRPNSPGGLQIGTAPVNWNNNDLPDWRPLVPFPYILDEMWEAGYQDTEWDESFGTDIAMLNHERSARGMAFTGAYRWLDFVDDDQFARDLTAIRPFMETLQGIGATHLIVADALRPHRVAIAGSIPADGSASLARSDYERLAANLERLAEDAARFGLAAHYHNHVGSYIETSDEIEPLLDLLDDSPVDLCFDTGHFAFGGGDASEFVAVHHARIGYLHLKDVDAAVLARSQRHAWSFMDALRQYIFSPIGCGNARVADIVATLVRVGFPHYVIVEQDTCRGNSTTNARVNLEMVRKFEAIARQERRNS